MERYDALNAPAPGAPYVNADLIGRTEGSYPPAEVFDAVQTEIISAITALGGVPNNASWTQLGLRIIAYVAAQITAGTSGKVDDTGDAMTGALTIALAALQFSLRHSNNTASLQDHARLFRGSGAGARVSIQSLGDAANGISELDINFLSSVDGLVKAFKLKNSGRLELGADPTLALEAATKQYVDAATLVSDASTTVKGKVELLTDAEAAALVDTVRAMTASNLGAIFRRSIANPGFICMPGVFKMQWGLKTSVANSTDGSGANSTVTLPDAFATDMYGAVVTLAGPSGGPVANTAAIAVSGSQFKIAGSQAGNNNYFWFAVGKD